jgi:hypothetical protein
MRVRKQSLPRPGRERWQPLRSGLVNIYRYDSEEFHYENGRMLLRGNNGTGKSRVLALQLPFLLDADVTPQRLEPDGEASKRVEWNLLMDRYPDRTGYTWIEFGRCEGDGAGRSDFYLTLGCGLNAAEGRPGVRSWFFITTQRIGQDLELITEGKQVINKEKLREKIGTAGRVFDSAGQYRQAVDEALFGLGAWRYASLINLLLQLRRPQLTRRLDEQELSLSLGEALPPLSRDVIASVAEALRTVTADRAQLNTCKTSLAAVDQFLIGYRRYAEIAARRRADRVLAVHREYETALHEVLNAEAECDRSLAELARLKTELHDLAAEAHTLETVVVAFRQSSNNNAHDIEQAHREAAEKWKIAEQASSALGEASRSRNAWQEEHHRLTARTEQRRLQLAAAADSAREAAVSADMEVVNADAFDREKTDLEIQARLEKIEHARDLNRRVAAAAAQAERAVTERDQLRGLLDDAREHLNFACEEHKSAVTSFLTAVANWTADLTELPLPCDDAFLKSVSEWCDTPARPNPFGTESRKAFEELTQYFADNRAYLKQLEKSRAVLPVAEPTETEPSLDSILDAMDDLNRREITLRSEVQTAPVDEHVRAAYQYSIALARHVDYLRNRLGEAEEYVRQKQSETDQVSQARDRALEDLAIGRWRDDLDSLKNHTAHYRFALSSMSHAIESFKETRIATEAAWAHLQEASAREAKQKEFADEQERRAAAAEIVLQAAQASVDADSTEMLRRVAEAQERLEQLRIKEKELRRRYHDTEVSVTRLDERLRNRTEMLNGQTERQDTAASALLALQSTGLLQIAAPGIIAGQAAELALELRSRLDAANVTGANDREWEEHQKSIPAQFNTLMQVLPRYGCQSAGTFFDDVFAAKVIFAGRECTIDELRQMLFDDVAARQKLVDAREVEILENELAGNVSRHLRELLRAAGEQVEQMNAELESCPTSTGMKLRFVWRPAENAPAGTAEAGRRLVSDDAWSSADRQMLGSFLQRQIQAAGSDSDGLYWEESVADALDYRKWHWFGIERYQDGVWKRLTRRTFGTGSGGEKAIALTLPYFAATAAFYRTADPLAPRLILLDEAFVGIDADMRAKCMGLIHTFDLDFMMTSEREWGCFPTLPGLAIYNLSTRPGIDAVGLTRWVWNGRQRELSSTEPPSVPAAFAATAGL